MFRKSSIKIEIIIIFIIIFSNYLLPTNIASPLILLVGILLLLSSNRIRSFKQLKFVKPLIIVLLIGTFGVFNHELRNVLRDISFALIPISLFLIGYWIAGNIKIWNSFFKVLCLLGLTFATIYLSKFLFRPDLLSLDIDEIRNETSGIGSSLPLLVLVLILTQRWTGFRNGLPKNFYIFIFSSILISSFLLSFSRTGVLTFIALFIALMGLFGRMNFKTISSLILILILIIGIVFISDVESNSFLTKFSRSFTELNIRDSNYMPDIHRNWRGYESFRALDSYSSGNIKNYLFGHGFGALIDLKIYMTLGQGEFRYIPTLHNGYLYILFKTGILGLICYTLFFFTILKFAKANNNSVVKDNRFYSNLIIGIILNLIIEMFVIGGMAEFHSVELVLILGYSVRRLEQNNLTKIKLHRILNVI